MPEKPEKVEPLKHEPLKHDKPAHDKPAKKHTDTGGPAFVRAGGQLVNLNHVVAVDLPVEGDAKKPLLLKLVNGTNLTLTGDDAACVMAALDACCAAE